MVLGFVAPMLMMNEPVEKVSFCAKLCLRDSKLKRRIKQIPKHLFLRKLFIESFFDEMG